VQLDLGRRSKDLIMSRNQIDNVLNHLDLNFEGFDLVSLEERLDCPFPPNECVDYSFQNCSSEIRTIEPFSTYLKLSPPHWQIARMPRVHS
jgi:hypothetical protein